MPGSSPGMTILLLSVGEGGGVEAVAAVAELARHPHLAVDHHVGQILGREAPEQFLDARLRAAAIIFQRNGAIGAHPLLVEEAIEQPVRRQHGIEQLVVLDRLGKSLGARPVLLGEGRLPPNRAAALAGELLHEKPSGAPGPGPAARLAGAIMPRHGKLDEGGELLGLSEIGIGGLGQAIALERHHALIALGLEPAVDGHGEMAVTEQPPVGRKRRKPLRREARIAAQASRHLIVGDQEIDRSVGRGLEDELALEFERGAEQRGQRHGLAEKLRHGFRIGMAREDGVDRGPELDETARDLGVLRLERQDQIVLREAKLDLALGRMLRHRLAPRALALLAPRLTPRRPLTGRSSLRHQARIAFCTCSRFSASSHTADCGPSITSAVTSSPRWAGKQCMKIASFAACAITRPLTWNGRRASVRFFSSLSPIETQTSVTTQSAPRAACSGSSLSSMSAPSFLAQSSSAGEGAKFLGEAILSLQPKRAAACTHDVATLLASPIQAIVRPSIGPFSSSKVITSAIT